MEKAYTQEFDTIIQKYLLLVNIPSSNLSIPISNSILFPKILPSHISLPDPIPSLTLPLALPAKPVQEAHFLQCKFFVNKIVSKLINFFLRHAHEGLLLCAVREIFLCGSGGEETFWVRRGFGGGLWGRPGGEQSCKGEVPSGKYFRRECSSTFS